MQGAVGWVQLPVERVLDGHAECRIGCAERIDQDVGAAAQALAADRAAAGAGSRKVRLGSMRAASVSIPAGTDPVDPERFLEGGL